MRCYRKILRISYKDHVTNEEARAKIQWAIGPHEDRLTIIKRCKLQWYGHVSHSSGLAKTILQSTVKGGRRKSRQRKRWEDNIRKWTGLEFAVSQRVVENREKWKKLVAKSFVVPRQPSRLRDWWDEMRDNCEALGHNSDLWSCYWWWNIGALSWTWEKSAVRKGGNLPLIAKKKSILDEGSVQDILQLERNRATKKLVKTGKKKLDWKIL